MKIIDERDLEALQANVAGGDKTVAGILLKLREYRRSFAVELDLKIFETDSDPSSIKHAYKALGSSMPALVSFLTEWIDSETRRKLESATASLVREISAREARQA